MFDNIGPAELLVLALVGMFVLGPERLPQAAAWVARTVRTIKDYASGARDQLRQELGPDYEDLRKPLEDLRSIRELDPRRAVGRHLFADPPADGTWSGAPTPATPDPATAGGAVLGSRSSTGSTHGVAAAGDGAAYKGQSGGGPSGASGAGTSPGTGELAPLDEDAT